MLVQRIYQKLAGIVLVPAIVALTVLVCANAGIGGERASCDGHTPIRSGPSLHPEGSRGQAGSFWSAYVVPVGMLSESSTQAGLKLGPMRNPFASLPMAVHHTSVLSAWLPRLGSSVTFSRPALQILFCTWLT